MKFLRSVIRGKQRCYVRDVRYMVELLLGGATGERSGAEVTGGKGIENQWDL